MSEFSTSVDDLKAKAVAVHERLAPVYGAPIAFFSTKDPLSELVSALLSHRTRNADSRAAYHRLRGAFPTWEAVRDAPVAEVEAALAGVQWPEQKAPRIQQVLAEITARREGDLSLDFLADWDIQQARAWLETMNGVGPKTSAAVLLFSNLRRPALPVDSHHHRVAQRVGLIGPKVDGGAAHAILEAQLPADWDAQQVYDNHELLMLHGKNVCHYQHPACPRCVLTDLCDFYQRSRITSSPATTNTGSLGLGRIKPQPVKSPKAGSSAPVSPK